MNISGTRRLVVRLELMELAGTNSEDIRTLKGSLVWSIMLRHLCQGEKDQPWPSFIWVSHQSSYTKTPEDERLCVLCQLNEIESEEHVLIPCPLYCDIRNDLFHGSTNIYDNFNDLNDTDKLSFILSNVNIVIDSSKVCHNILTRRKTFTYM